MQTALGLLHRHVCLEFLHLHATHLHPGKPTAESEIITA